MPSHRRIPLRPLLALALAGGALAACAGTESASSSSRSRSTTLSSVFSSRPTIPVSVAEAHPSDAEQLDFFDDLERRDLVSHDDALHASLLLFAGQSGPTFVQRAGRAKQMNLLDPKFDRNPREAITIGELATILAAGMRRASTSESAAIESLREAGVLPDSISANAGVSGTQLLTILGHAEDAMAARAAATDPVRPLTPAEKSTAAAAVLQPEKKPTKKPPIDLEKEALKPRPGQVLPDVAPATPPAPAPETPSPAAPAPEMPPTAPAPTPSPSPAAPKPAPRPLPPPRADGGVPSRVDGVASDLRYVAVDRLPITATEILGPGEFVQWRAVDDGRGKPGEWQTLAAGQPLTERLELRTGLGARVALKVGDDAESATIVLHRLTRARIEKKIRSDGQAQIGVTIYRGVVEAAPHAPGTQGRAPVQIKTPDQSFPLRTKALFEYDAFRGTLAKEFRQ